MKTKAIIFGTVLVSCLALNAFGQFGQPIRAGEIIGSTLKDSQGQKVGMVKDLAVDLDNGRIAEVVVAWGGYLGVDSKLVGVPPDNFTQASDGKSIHLNMDKKALEGAPVVDISKWKDAMEQSRVEQVYHYNGLIPYFAVKEQQARNPNNPIIHHLGEVCRASQLIGAKTLNHQDQNLGKLENFVVTFPEGRIVEVTIATGRFLGMKGELSAVPPQALHFDDARDALTLDATKEALTSAPHFPSRTWPDIDREQATAVYQAYHVMPYFLPVGIDNSVQNAPEIKNNLPPLEQGKSQADLEITARIQKEILDADGLSVEARAVKVITVNGHVTLRGTVTTEDEKRRVGDIAAQVVPAADVDNQLMVKATARASN